MSDPFIPENLVTPGISDERSRALMAAFSKELEVIDNQALLIQDALTVDERLLPEMTVARAMSNFVMPNMRQNVVRQLLDNAHEIHAKTGYIEGVRLGLSLLGVEASWVQWWEEAPPALHDTHKVSVFFDQVLFDDSALADQRHRTVVSNIIEITKRHSQTVAVTFGVVCRVSQYVGAVASFGGRYTAAMPGEENTLYPIEEFAGAASLSAGTFTAGMEIN